MNLLKMTITPGKFKENKDQMISFLKKFLDHFNSIALFSPLKFLVSMKDYPLQYLLNQPASERRCGEEYSVEHPLICKRVGFIIQRHDELRNFEAELLSLVCSDVEIEPLLQEI